METVIKSLSNIKYGSFLDIRKDGKKMGLILVEGEDLVELAAQEGKLKEIIALAPVAKYISYPQTYLSNELYRKLSSYSSLPSMMGIASFSLSETIGKRVIYLDGIQDPGNLGTIERTALAFGFETVVLSSDCVSPFNFKAVQASKGAFFSLKICYRELADLLNDGYRLYMTALDGINVDQIKVPKEEKYAIVIGNEGQGISKAHLNLPCVKVLIPIDTRIDSLNAGVAAGIFMFLWGGSHA